MDSESTATSVDENTENLCDNPTRDTIAGGIVSLFQPIVDQLDERVHSTRYVAMDLYGFSHQIQWKILKFDGKYRVRQESSEIT